MNRSFEQSLSNAIVAGEAAAAAAAAPTAAAVAAGVTVGSFDGGNSLYLLCSGTVRLLALKKDKFEKNRLKHPSVCKQ